MMKSMQRQTPEPFIRVIRIVALFEGLKGILVLAAGCGLLLLIHKDVHAIAANLIRHSHLNPASRYPEIFLDAASSLHDSRIRLLALGAAVYTTVRFVEAYGLYYGKAWAEVFAAGSGAIYIPVELVELIRHVTPLRATLLLANVAVVAIMVGALLQRRRARAQSAPSPFSTAAALAQSMPLAERALGVHRTASFQALISLPAQEVVEITTSGRRVTLTTYRDVAKEPDREVRVAVQLVAYGWLGYRRVWTQGFRATSSGMRRELRGKELYR